MSENSPQLNQDLHETLIVQKNAWLTRDPVDLEETNEHLLGILSQKGEVTRDPSIVAQGGEIMVRPESVVRVALQVQSRAIKSGDRHRIHGANEALLRAERQLRELGTPPDPQ